MGCFVSTVYFTFLEPFGGPEESKDIRLVDIYKELGVTNVEPVPAPEAGDLNMGPMYDLGEGVVFYDDVPKSKGVAGPDIPKGKETIRQPLVRIFPNYADTKYFTGNPDADKNGWSEVRMRLAVKLPNRSLFRSEIRKMVDDVDFIKLDVLCEMMLNRSLYSFFAFLMGPFAFALSAAGTFGCQKACDGFHRRLRQIQKHGGRESAGNSGAAGYHGSSASGLQIGGRFSRDGRQYGENGNAGVLPADHFVVQLHFIGSVLPAGLYHG